MTKQESQKVSRGIRNHNPGNIRLGDPWQGLAPVQSDKEFCQFSAPKWGIRALARLLITYQDRHRVRTIRGIISRFAPNKENDTAAYIAAVVDDACDDALIGPDDEIDLHRYPVLAALVQAVIRHENGCQPYSRAEIDEGLKLAGVVPPANPAVRLSHKMATGGQIGVAATGVAAVVTSPDLREAVDATGVSWLMALFAIAALAGTGWLIWQRVRQAKVEA